MQNDRTLNNKQTLLSKFSLKLCGFREKKNLKKKINKILKNFQIFSILQPMVPIWEK